MKVPVLDYAFHRSIKMCITFLNLLAAKFCQNPNRSFIQEVNAKNILNLQQQ